MNKLLVIFSGYNQRAVISFLRTLKKDAITNYVIIASSEEDTIFHTEYKNKVFYTRRYKELYLEELLYIISDLCKVYEENEFIIVPSTEALNRFLLRNRNEFEKRHCIIPLVNQALYETISDKESFWKICSDNSIEVPNIITLGEQYQEPFVAKPKKYFSNDGNVYSPIIVKNEEEYVDFRQRYKEDDFDYQEYIDGTSYYLLFYFSKVGEVYSFSQENLAQQEGGKSIVAARTSELYLKKKVTEPYITLFQDMKYYGFVMVELREREGQYYMIEANPRFWGPSQLFCDSGYNFFEIFLHEQGIIEIVDLKKINQEARYFWSGGVIGDILSSERCVWYGNGKYVVKKDIELFKESDIYKKADTIEIYHDERACGMKKKLEELYMVSSKHSNYQKLPTCLSDILDEKSLIIQSRYEEERFEYIKRKVDICDKKILDVGGNIGYFTFEAINAGARYVDYYEGNEIHAEFVEGAVKLLDLTNLINVNTGYYMFDGNRCKYDVAYVLNVVHHLGDDFGKCEDIENAKNRMLHCINQLAKSVEILVFQMGYNWCGDRNRGLFENGTKQEMEVFIKEGTEQYWDIIHIGIAEKMNNQIIYTDMNEMNNTRKDEWGEFLNRPIFVMKSRVI